MANEQTKKTGIDPSYSDRNDPLPGEKPEVAGNAPDQMPARNQVQDETAAGIGEQVPTPVLVQANGGMIDKSITPTKPVYVHAGSMGGQNAWDCDLCGAVVRDAFQNQHDAFHAQVAGVLRYTGVR